MLALKLKHKKLRADQLHVDVFLSIALAPSSRHVWLLCGLIRSEGITVIGRLVNH